MGACRIKHGGAMIYDLHSHILPGMDDGAKDADTCREMLEMAVEQGTTGIVATPHIIGTKDFSLWPQIVSACKFLNEIGREKGWNIGVYPGAEVAVSNDILSFLKEPGPFCINGANYILLELPAHQIPHYIDEIFFTLQVRGFEIVLAHPERQTELIRHPDVLWNWLDRGILVQVSGTSLMGVMGKTVMEFAEMLVRRGAVYCIGSDAHGLGRRNPGLRETAKKLTALAGAEATRRILEKNPLRLLSGADNTSIKLHDSSQPRTSLKAPLRFLSSLFEEVTQKDGPNEHLF